MKEDRTQAPEITIGIDLGDRSSELCISGRGQDQPEFETMRTALLRALRG